MKSYYRLYQSSDKEDVINLKLREADINELRASLGLEPKEALELSLACSKITWVVVHNGFIEGVFGLAEGEKDDGLMYGVPWFLATDIFTEYSYRFAKKSKEVLKLMLDKYDCLMNLVDSRNYQAIKWLEWLGFTVNKWQYIPCLDPEVYFYYFYLNK